MVDMSNVSNRFVRNVATAHPILWKREIIQVLLQERLKKHYAMNATHLAAIGWLRVVLNRSKCLSKPLDWAYRNHQGKVSIRCSRRAFTVHWPVKWEDLYCDQYHNAGLNYCKYDSLRLDRFDWGIRILIYDTPLEKSCNYSATIARLLWETIILTSLWSNLSTGTCHGEQSEAISLPDWRLLRSQRTLSRNDGCAELL